MSCLWGQWQPEGADGFYDVQSMSQGWVTGAILQKPSRNQIISINLPPFHLSPLPSLAWCWQLQFSVMHILKDKFIITIGNSYHHHQWCHRPPGIWTGMFGCSTPEFKNWWGIIISCSIFLRLWFVIVVQLLSIPVLTRYFWKVWRIVPTALMTMRLWLFSFPKDTVFQFSGLCILLFFSNYFS